MTCGHLTVPRLTPGCEDTRGGRTRAAEVRRRHMGFVALPPGAPQPLAQALGTQLTRSPQATSRSPSRAPDAFTMRVRLEDTGEMFRVANCRSDMTVRELKEELDLMVGIPSNLQRLQYLDQGVLMDESTLKFHDVVPGGIISLLIWHYDGWTDLVLAAVEGDANKLSSLGVTEDSLYRTANSAHFTGKRWKKWTSQRASVALYITSHRGHLNAVRYLLEHGANCLSTSPVGRTPLHVAAAMGRVDCISLLFDYGASINARDAKGETPISIARRLNRKQSERRMFLIHWVAKSGAKALLDSTLTTGPRGSKSAAASKKPRP